MTCTTHHICDCMKERMEKLGRLLDATKSVAWQVDCASNMRTGEHIDSPEICEACVFRKALEDLK